MASTTAQTFLQSGELVVDAAKAQTQAVADANTQLASARAEAQELILGGLSNLGDTIEDFRELNAENQERQQLFNTKIIESVIDDIDDPEKLKAFDILDQARAMRQESPDLEIGLDGIVSANKAKDQQFADILNRQTKVDKYNEAELEKTKNKIWNQFRDMHGDLSAKEQRKGIASYLQDFKQKNPNVIIPEDMEVVIGSRVDALDYVMNKESYEERIVRINKARGLTGQYNDADAKQSVADAKFKAAGGNEILTTVPVADRAQIIQDSLYSVSPDGKIKPAGGGGVVGDYDIVFNDSVSKLYNKLEGGDQDKLLQALTVHSSTMNQEINRLFLNNGEATVTLKNSLAQPYITKLNKLPKTKETKAERDALKQKIKNIKSSKGLRLNNNVMSLLTLDTNLRELDTVNWTNWVDNVGLEDVNSRWYVKNLREDINNPNSLLHRQLLEEMINVNSALEHRKASLGFQGLKGDIGSKLSSIGYGVNGNPYLEPSEGYNPLRNRR